MTRYTITANSLNFRSAPSINANVVWVGKKDQTVQVVGTEVVKEVNNTNGKTESRTWMKVKSNNVYIYGSSAYLEVTKTRAQRCWEAAKKYSDQMLDDGNWYYRNNNHKASKNYADSRKGEKGSSCSYFASWCMQYAGVIGEDKIVSHTSAGTGSSTIAKVVVRPENVVHGKIYLLNKKLKDAEGTLSDGDIVLQDSSIGVYGHINGKACVITGRSGATLDSKGRYKNMTLYSGYEFNNKTLAVIHPED